MDGGFAFAFGGDDIHNSTNIVSHTNASQGPLKSNGSNDSNDLNGRQARVQNLQEMLESLPSQLTYSSVELVDENGNVFSVLKRDYTDVHVQMMAEDEGEYSAYLSGSDDIKESEYEGGFKTWECAVDLATLAVQMCSKSSGMQYRKIIELGCGSAIPTLVMFQNALENNQYPSTFTLADYNEEVLRLLTVPNLLLNWAKVKRNLTESSAGLLNLTLYPTYEQEENQTSTEFSRSANYDSSNDANKPLLSSLSGHFEITPQMITLFLSDLENHRISINLISGSWHPADKFTYLLSSTTSSPSSSSSSIPFDPISKTLILSSETIYSPKSLHPFTDILETMLRQQQDDYRRERQDMTSDDDDDDDTREIEAQNTSKALVATKRLYFGVGGGVDAFIHEVEKRGMLVQECDLTEVKERERERERESKGRTKNGSSSSNSSNSNSMSGGGWKSKSKSSLKNDMKRDKYTSTGSVSRCIVEVQAPKPMMRER